MSRYCQSPRGRRLLVALAAVMCILAGPAAVIAVAAPEYISPPEVSGHAAPGERLVCSSGTWKGTFNSGAFQYEWVREGFEFTSGPTYTLSKSDEHKEIWCIVTATNNKGESTRADSVNSICFPAGSCHVEPPIEPEPIEPRPKVSGEAKVGATLTCSQGTWIGRPTPTFTYKWLRDQEAITSATSNEYTVKPEDETHALSCRVTATNEAGKATAESTNKLEVPGTPPKNTSPPEVLGVAAVNETLTCSEGTWTGSAPLTFEFEWLRNGTTKIAATPTYTVLPSDEGQSLSCTVTAKNGLSKTGVVAVSAAVKVSGKLKSTGAPVISGAEEGAVKEGSLLTCSEGIWNQPTAELKLKYQWLHENNEAILGATEKTYKVKSSDRTHLIYCQVVAKNEGKKEEAVALSEPVRFPGSGVPTEKSSPAISGTLSFGHVLNCLPGEWINSIPPTTYVFQWLRDKIAIASATEETYTVKAADESHLLSCKVIAENSEGPSKPAESAPQRVQGEAPSVSAPKVHSGSPTPHVGESLTCLLGEWKGEPHPTFEYEWLQDGTTKIGSEQTYTIASANRGHSLSCIVTASNNEGSASASSNSIKIPGSPPEPPVAGPTISGEAAIGSTLTCSHGEWTGAPPPTFTYQWLLNGSAVPSATGETFIVGSADRGYVLSCKVTGTNSEGTELALSKGVHVPGVPPAPVELPFVSGTGVVGAQLTCQRGIWNGKPPPSFTYQWFRDGTAIASATEAAYTVEPGDQSHLLSCNVTATNSEGSVEEESTNSLAVASHTTQGKNENSGTFGTVKPPILPSPAVILASLNRQLTAALSEAHIKVIMKRGSFSFSFIAPATGTLEVLWYQIVKGAHGSKSKQLVLAQSTTSLSGLRKGTIRLKLTAKGRQVLKNKKRLSLKAKAIFTIPNQKPVIWSVTLVLTR